MAHLYLNNGKLTDGSKRKPHISLDENGNLGSYSSPKKHKKSNTSSVPKSDYNTASGMKNSYLNQEKNLKQQSNNLKNMYSNAGIITNNSGFLPIADRSSFLANNMKYDYNKNNIPLPGKNNPVELDKKIVENQNKFNELNNNEDVKKQIQDVEKQYDITAKSYYDYLQQKVAEDDIGIIDKTIGVPIRGALSMFSNGRYSLKNEKGESFIMPTYNDLKQQKVMDSYETWVGKVLGGAGYELGKIGTSAALNAVVPGLGGATYYGNIFKDQLNNSIAEGYDSKGSLAYATLGTIAEVVTGKILGGTTNAIFGTGTSEMSQSISKGLSKALGKYPNLVNAVSNAVSEGSEEFLQEFIDKFNKNLTLDKENKLFDGVFTKETFEDAIYSATVGALTGAITGGMDGNDYYKLEQQRNQYIKDVTTLPQNNTIQETLNKDFISNKLQQDELNNVKLPIKYSLQEKNNQYNINNNNEVKSYSNITEAIYDYANSIKDNFNSEINIKTNENIIPIDYSRQSQTTIFNKAKEMFSKIGKTVFRNGNEDIYVSNGDIKESIAKTIRNTKQKKLIAEHIEVFNNLDKIIENGILIAKSDETKSRERYKNWNYYATPIKINGKNYIVQFDTVYRTDDNNRKHFRLERIYSLEEVTKKQVVPTETLANLELANATRFVEQPVSINNDTTINTSNQVVPSINNMQQKDVNIPIKQDSKESNKALDPIEISNLSKGSANTTPLLPIVNRNENNDGNSSYFDNIKDKTNMLTEEQKNKILSSDEVKYYDKITNKESLDIAFERLNKNGSNESLKWFGKDSKNADATDVAEGWILLKQYADNNDYDSMVEVAKKLRDIGTQAGQTVQAFNIMERMTPEGMVKYAQSELTEAYNTMVKNKSKEWIDKYRSDFDLKPNEVQFIMDTMKEVSTMEDGYDKKVKLAEIQKIMTDKLPPQKGSKIKSWMRISMLFNPKTQVRNVAGNAIIAPVNYFGDLFSSYADKLISKKTNVRTTGNMNVKAILKGFKDGAHQATNDYIKGINTKDMTGNRFEIGEGKSFSDKNIIGRNLNRVEGLLNYIMDAGDRIFSQSSFENSLQNQMILNNTTEVTQEMIDIATTESLQRTWNENNNYTKFVLDIRRMLNRIGTENYGLGDILIPFAKTPANLTKAIVDYSPVGLVNTLIRGNNLRKSLTNGQYTPQIQHKFVQSLGKATAGTILYIAGLSLAKAGITSGESDDDKDTANFLKNTLGISSYSIKIGDKSFTYDWAQPLAAPLSITANIVNSKNRETALLESIIGNLDTAGSILLEQSFLQSLNDVLNSNDGVVSGLVNEILELPARAIPTFSKQIVDLTDSTQRTSYEYGKPLETAFNNIKAKIPGLSKTLAPSVDTMGREIQRYGGKNNLFNVFLNPANVNTENVSKSAQEIYNLYKETGDLTIMPRVTPYYINKNGEKTVLSSVEKAQYQKVSGKIIEDNVSRLLNNSAYKNLSSNDKKDIIKSIVDYSYNKAREEITNIPMSDTYKKINKYIKNGGKVSDYYLNKEEINYSLDNPEKYKVVIKITDYNHYLDYKKNIENFKGENRKNNIINYINSLKLNIPQKAMFIKMYYPSYDNYNDSIVNYINSQKITTEDKMSILQELGFKIKDGKVY